MLMLPQLHTHMVAYCGNTDANVPFLLFPQREINYLYPVCACVCVFLFVLFCASEIQIQSFI